MSATVLTIVGARPQFIKAAPVSTAFVRAGIREVMVHTGQHFDPDMSDQFFTELGLPEPAYNLRIHSLSQGAMTGRMLEALEAVIVREKPNCVLVYGDTNSTLAGALAAAKLQAPLAHVEAGLRSFNRHMPEEVNRVLTDHVSNLLFCPTISAIENLRREGITAGVHAVGDVMFDSALMAARLARRRSTILRRYDLHAGGYSAATIHRAENTDDPERFSRVLGWLEAASEERPIVLPMHPRTRPLIQRMRWQPNRIKLLPPLSYLDMTMLVSHAAAVFTDSGGLQKEAYFHRVPCVTLRDETEWIETVDAGWNRLWTQPEYRPRREINEYGNGD
ncbi:MAG: UDP-N-acetylglucosamine 2-epimerase (non-hydrolyzing), partial [Acetobacteraceae bacterium]|nr:UDP-N-acetylglucosamine 2-epimerase (non-hydrolyzing) [Acetobacteraceae bacterium]